MSKDRLRVWPNERIDIDDFRFAVGEDDRANLHELTEEFMKESSIVGSEDRTGYILSGFAISNPSAKQLQVTKGKAFLSQRLNGAVVRGVLTVEGDATKIVDLNTYPAGTYGVYIRFEEVAGDVQNRIFWDPTGDGSEYADAKDTRYVAGWSLRVEATSPGSEWLLIGEVAQATMTITDKRPFYFEGAVDSSYSSGWSSDGDGQATDRNANRALYGVKDLHTFVRAMKQCLEDIKGRGLKRWWDRDIGGMNIGFDANPVAGRLAIGDAAFYARLDMGSDDPLLVFDTDTFVDYFLYDRSNDTLTLSIDGPENHVWDTDTYTTENVIVQDTLAVSSSAGEGVGSSLMPTSGGTFNIGSNAYDWDDIFCNRIASDTFSPRSAQVWGGNLVPTTGSYDLGSVSYPWEWGFMTNLVWTKYAYIFLYLSGPITGITTSQVNVTPVTTITSNYMYSETPGGDGRIRANQGGVYKFDFTMMVSGDATGVAIVEFVVKKNGSDLGGDVEIASLVDQTPANTARVCVTGSFIVSMITSDYVQIFAKRSGGAAATLTVHDESKLVVTMLKQTAP